MDQGEVRTIFTASAEQCSYHGVAHGGVLSALLDETMGWAAAFEKRIFCYAAELRVRFLQHAPPGKPLTVVGRMTTDRGRIWETEGEIRGEDGVIYARGWGKYIPMSEEQTLEVMKYLVFDDETVSREDLLPPSSSE